MKHINKKQQAPVLKDIIKIGDFLRVYHTTLGQNAIGLNYHQNIVKITKINKVTVEGIIKDTNEEVRLDLDDLCDSEIIEVFEVARKTNICQILD